MNTENELYLTNILNNQKLVAYYNNWYIKFSKENPEKEKIEKLANDLKLYVGENRDATPDYSGYYLKARTYFNKRDDIIAPYYETFTQENYRLNLYNCTSIEILLFVMLCHKVFLLNKSIDEERKKNKSNNDYWRLWKEYKLLFGLMCKKNFNGIVTSFGDFYRISCLKYLDDDIESADIYSIKHRLIYAITTRQKSMAFKLLGRLRQVDIGEAEYFEAITHYINGEFNDCIHYIDKIPEDAIDYRSAVALKLECLSAMGNPNAFIECLKENERFKIDTVYLVTLLAQLILNCSFVFEDKSYEEDFLKKLESLNSFIICDIDNSLDYINRWFILLTRCIEEIISHLENLSLRSMELSDEKAITKLILRLTQLNGAYFYLCQIISHDDSTKFDFFPDLENYDIQELKNNALIFLTKIWNAISSKVSPNSLIEFLLAINQLGNVNNFLQEADKYHTYFRLLLKTDWGDKVREFLRIVYVEKAARGLKCDDLISLISVDDNEQKKMEMDIEYQRAMNAISLKGKSALEAAEWQYRASLKEDYGWKDAGMISLSYFRIIELEINEKVIKPLITIDIEGIKSTYNQYCLELHGKERERFKKRWKKNLDTFIEISNDKENSAGLMLGGIEYFFRDVQANNDPLSARINNDLSRIFTSIGKEKLDSGWILHYIDNDTRNLYRNPPAHTRYLQYGIACDCRTLVLEFITDFDAMLIKNNI